MAEIDLCRFSAEGLRVALRLCYGKLDILMVNSEQNVVRCDPIIDMNQNQVESQREQ